MQKSLDAKLAKILADPGCGEFILADAKDGDMAYGVGGLGKNADGSTRTLEDYRGAMRDNVRQGLLDIMLMSASSCEQLSIREGLFQGHVTPACRANDTTDIHLAHGSVYRHAPSRPFRTATIDHIMYGRALSDAERQGAPVVGADLGLYSITFNNDLERDLEALERYRDFRIEAERLGFRHFLEVFDPNACGDTCPEDLGRYLNDMIVRTLAGVVSAGRPLFLKIPYHGPAAMEGLASWDRSVVPGILGGASGTSFDAFHQLREARKYGARVALYGRMINNSEHQPSMVQHLRWIADGELDDATEAVRSYHAALERHGIRPHRSLDEDMKPSSRGSAYGGGSVRSAVVTKPAAGGTGERVAANLARWDRVLG